MHTACIGSVLWCAWVLRESHLHFTCLQACSACRHMCVHIKSDYNILAPATCRRGGIVVGIAILALTAALEPAQCQLSLLTHGSLSWSAAPMTLSCPRSQCRLTACPLSLLLTSFRVCTRSIDAGQAIAKHNASSRLDFPLPLWPTIPTKPDKPA